MSFDERGFYPTVSASPVGIVADPTNLPRFLSEGAVWVRDYPGGRVANNYYTFWDAISFVGAVVPVTDPFVWTEVVNITGKGFLGNVIAPHSDTADKALGIRIERDGVVWEWEETIVGEADESTMVLGALSAGSSDRHARFPQTIREVNSAGWAHVDGPSIVPVEYLLSDGRPLLSFEQSLSVSVKTSVVNATNEGDQAGCTYTLR